MLKSVSISVFLITPAILFSLAISAEASQWVIAAKGRSTVNYVDIDSIKGTGDIRNFWKKSIYNEDQTTSQRPYKSTVTKSWVNCKTRQIGSSRIVSYDEKGSPILSSPETAEPEEWDSVLPDSVGEAILEVVCNLKTGRSDRELQSQPPNTGNLGRDRVVFLVKRWLQAKGKIFALHPDRQLALQLTTGKLYKDLTQPNGQLDWLENQGAFYEYGVQRIHQIHRYSESATKIVVQAYVVEESRIFQGDIVIKSSGGPETLLVRYEFEKTGKNWKLADLAILETN
jgi:hypothetical protein